MRSTSYLLGVSVLATCAAARADLTEFTDFTQWQAAAGLYTTIEFNEVPAFSIVTTQYEPVGVSFVDSLYQTICCSSLVYPQDETGLDGNGWVTLEFSQPMTSIAAHYPGALTFTLYSGSELTAISSDFFVTTPIGSDGFAGVVSTIPFDRAVLTRARGFGDSVFLDNLYFGPSVPGPAAFPVLAWACLRVGARRRLTS